MSASGRILRAFSSARRPLRLLGASGQLGYGIPTAPFEAGLARQPDLIGCDMGSIDPGPYYLGSGQMATAPAATRRDLRKVLHGARRLDVPLVIGTAGSAGARPHLDATLDMVRDIAREDGLHFRMAVIPGDVDREIVRKALRAGQVSGFDGMPALTEAELEASTHLVGQMGLDAFSAALAADVDVLIAGRACDTAIFAALPVMLGFPTGLAIHLAKIIECASLCCLPGGRDAMLATLDDTGFELESMAPQRAATPTSVAAHSLYEQSDPFSIVEPSGAVDLSAARYDALDERRTRVSGAAWTPAAQRTIKLEGARFVGERAILLCGAADPRFIAQHREILPAVAEVVRGLVCEDAPQDYRLDWKVYGVDGVAPKAADAPVPGEVFLLVQCIAPTQARAGEVVRTMKQYLLHHGYAGRLSTGGNIAFPFTPPEVAAGPAYEFNVYHLMQVADEAALFPFRVEAL